MASPNRRRTRNLAITLLLIGWALWAIPPYFSAERFRRRIQAGLEQALHRPIKFGALSLHLVPRPGFAIENAEVAEDPDFGLEPLARVDEIRCELRWTSLWHSRMEFTHLTLDHPSVNVVINSRGEWNVERFLLQSGATAPAGTVLSGMSSRGNEPLDLEVSDAHVAFQVSLNKKALALTDVKAHFSISPIGRRVEFQMTASPLRSDRAIPTPGPVSLRGVWTPGSDLAGPIDARIRTEGALLYDWVPVIIGDNPQIYGVMDTNLHITGSLPQLLVEGETKLADVHRWQDIPPSDSMPWTFRYRARLTRSQGQVQFQNLDAAFADSHLHLTGSIAGLPADPQFDLVLSLDRSRLQDVLAVVRRLRALPTSSSLRGRVDGMLSIQGTRAAPHFGGYITTQRASIDTSSGSYPLSDAALRINKRGVVLAPVQITLAPHVILTLSGTVTHPQDGPRYAIQVGAKGVPLRQVVDLARGLGIRGMDGIEATGSANATIVGAGPAWPPSPPLFNGHAQIKGARLLIPGLVEPLDIASAAVEFSRERIRVAHLTASIGASVFTGEISHVSPRETPWQFELRANALNLDQSAQWIGIPGRRPRVTLLDRLPGMGVSHSRPTGSPKSLNGMHAEGTLVTPALTCHGISLNNFHSAVTIINRVLKVESASFMAAGGRGRANAAADFSTAPPTLSAKLSLAGASIKDFSYLLPRSWTEPRGWVTASVSLVTRGLTGDDLSRNLTGQVTAHARDFSFGGFDLLGTVADRLEGSLEPSGEPATCNMKLNMEFHDRRLLIKTAPFDLSGALLEVNGAYSWGEDYDLDVHADFRRLRRRWAPRDDSVHALPLLTDVRLSGPVRTLAATPGNLTGEASTAGKPPTP